VAKQSKPLPTIPPANFAERPPRTTTLWATKQLKAARADEGFYRICGVKGSGKSHLTKVFILDALREVETNPHAKMVVYDPKREFYAWLSSIGLKSKISYFMPSDLRSVALDFTKDYATDQDCMTLANAFYPEDPNERQRFWGDALRTIYAQVFSAIKGRRGYADLRLMCLVLEDQELTRAVLGHDPYLVQATALLGTVDSSVGETARNILMTVHSRISQMKVLAAHLEDVPKEKGLFSLRDFVKQEDAGILVVSKDSDYGLTQDPMNGVLFLRLTQLLDKEQQDPRRKVFVVIDEFPTLAGDKPCPGITDMFLRLRSRGVTVLVTYQSHASLKRIYGEAASENIGQCTNVIYLRQADKDSAQYAAEDLGREWGKEMQENVSFGTGRGGVNYHVNQGKQWFDRQIYPATELLNFLSPASKEKGIEGRAKSPEGGQIPWKFVYPPQFIDQIPRPHPEIEEYEEREAWTQRLSPLTDGERRALLGQTEEQPEKEPWDTIQD